MIIAILMGRKKSQGFPGKNLYNVLGKPLSYYPLKAALDCPEVDKTYLSTDDEKLMELASRCGASTIERPSRLCTNEALGEHVFVHAYNIAKEQNKGKKIELVILLMCNAATITSKKIQEGIKILRENPNHDSAVTVSKYNMWSPLRARKVDKDGLLKPFIPFKTFGDPKTLNCDRDSQGDVWFADMGASIIRPRNLEHLENGMLPQKWMGQKIAPIFQEGGLDVDYIWQIPMVEYWLKNKGIFKKTKEKNARNKSYRKTSS